MPFLESLHMFSCGHLCIYITHTKKVWSLKPQPCGSFRSLTPNCVLTCLSPLSDNASPYSSHWSSRKSFYVLLKFHFFLFITVSLRVGPRPTSFIRNFPRSFGPGISLSKSSPGQGGERWLPTMGLNLKATSSHLSNYKETSLIRMYPPKFIGWEL